MAKLGQQIADTSFRVPPIANGTHTFEIREVKDVTANSGAQGVEFLLKIESTTESSKEEEVVGRSFRYTVWIIKKDGDYNETGGRELKNLIRAVLGEDAANDPDTETEQLAAGRFAADLKHTENDEGQINYRLSKYTTAD